MFLTNSKSWIYSTIKYVFFVFISIFPFILYKSYLYNGTSSRAVTLMWVIDLLAIIFGFYLLSSKKLLARIKSPVLWALLIYAGVLIISALQGIDPSISLWSKATRVTGIFYFLHLIVFYTFTVLLFKEERTFRQLLNIVAVSTGIFSLGSLLGPEGFKIIFTSKPWDGFTFGNSTFAAMYLFGAFLIGVYLVLTQAEQKRRGWKYLLPFIILLNPNFINPNFLLGKGGGVIGEARATTYAILFSIVVLVVFKILSYIKSIKTRRTIIWTGVVLVPAVIFVAVVSLLSPNGFLRKIYLEQSTQARPVVWELSSKAIAERPILGWGPENFEQVFQTHYDNRLLQAEYGGEPWFDRAHNVFFDQTVDAGYIGLITYLLIYAALLGMLVYVILRSVNREDKIAASILIAYFLGHILELQTAFDTSISYPIMMIMAAFATVIFNKTYKRQITDVAVPEVVQYVLGVIMIGVFGWAFFAGTIPITKAEMANGSVHTVGSSAGRMTYYNSLFGSPMDKATFLWRTTTDLQRGISQQPSIIEDPKRREGFVKEINYFIKEYQSYIEKHPNDYRAQLNLADQLIYLRLFNEDRLQDSQVALDSAIKLNPSIPQAYWMKSVAYLYMHDFKNAKLWAQKGLELNPSIQESQKVVKYIDESIKTFPEINLYFFRQI